MSLGTDSCALIDVRSENEFRQGSVPGFVNAPVLRDQERHEVGICYRYKGSDAAVALGHDLISPTIEERIALWRQTIAANANATAIITCWRGGLRSRLVCDTLLKMNFDVKRVSGGYKAMRQQLMIVFDTLPDLFVLGGLTGSGKTALI